MEVVVVVVVVVTVVWHQKTRVPGVALFSHLSRTTTCDRQTDRHMTMAYTALAWRRAVKIEWIGCWRGYLSRVRCK